MRCQKCGLDRKDVLDPPQAGLNLFTEFSYKHLKWEERDKIVACILGRRTWT